MIPSVAKRLFGRRSRAENLEEEEFWAVKDVSFEVKPGEALGIIGPNGAGKSTVLKVLTRILKPTRGRCEVRGRVGALIEVAAGFHPDLTGRENVYLQGAIMGMRRAEMTRRFGDVVEFAGVEEFIDTPVRRYSNGMNARLGFSIAAHLDPQVLIIDEVMSVGDMAFQLKCLRRMEEFCRQGVAIAFVSHDLQAVRRLCSCAVLLDRGACVKAGAIDDVINAYLGMTPSSATSPSGTEGAVVRLHNLAPPEVPIPIVRPRQRMNFSLEVAIRETIRNATVGVVIRKMPQLLYAYGVAIQSLGVPPLKAEPGDRFSYELTFESNLARGLYAIEIEVWDVDRQRAIAPLRPYRQFSVVEDLTYDGVANVFLTVVSCAATPLVVAGH